MAKTRRSGSIDLGLATGTSGDQSGQRGTGELNAGEAETFRANWDTWAMVLLCMSPQVVAVSRHTIQGLAG